jgi:hypothetical protein
MKSNEVFPSKYVKADDIGDREVTVVIDKVVIETVGEEQKPVAYFRGAKKGLVLNRTNWDRISYVAKNDDSDSWLGVAITLTTELVSFQGKTGPAVRVKPAKQQQAAAPAQLLQPPLAEDLNDRINF